MWFSLFQSVFDFLAFNSKYSLLLIFPSLFLSILPIANLSWGAKWLICFKNWQKLFNNCFVTFSLPISVPVLISLKFSFPSLSESRLSNKACSARVKGLPFWKSSPPFWVLTYLLAWLSSCSTKTDAVNRSLPVHHIVPLWSRESSCAVTRIVLFFLQLNIFFYYHRQVI